MAGTDPRAVLIFPDTALRKKSKKVLDIDAIRPMISGMQGAMRRDKGVALAAPQVGVLRRFFVAKCDPLPPVIVNPEWKRCDDATSRLCEEGCLSFPGIFVRIPRWDRISVSFSDLEGRHHQMVLSDFPAQVFQHEVDHLDGILLIDKVKRYV